MRECEDLIKCMQSKSFSRLELVADLPEVSHVWSMEEVEGGHDSWITTGQKVQSGYSVI